MLLTLAGTLTYLCMLQYKRMSKPFVDVWLDRQTYDDMQIYININNDIYNNYMEDYNYFYTFYASKTYRTVFLDYLFCLRLQHL